MWIAAGLVLLDPHAGQENRPCFELLSLHWQQSFWSAPASCRMMRSHVGAVVAVTGVAEAFTEVPPVWGGVRGGAVGVRGGRYGVAGRGYAGRGYGYGYRRPVARAAGAAAVGAAAAGAYGYYGGGYYGNSCYQDGYGNTVCPQQYRY